MHSSWLLVAYATIAVGCAESRPPPRTLAAALEARCRDDPGATDARIVGSMNVDQVEPIYALVRTGRNGMEARLAGARIHLRAIDGVTVESVGHAITCHAAHEVLGEAGDSCPYYVPGVWVDIDVKQDVMGYDVALRGQDYEEARRILERARAFARN